MGQCLRKGVGMGPWHFRGGRGPSQVEGLLGKELWGGGGSRGGTLETVRRTASSNSTARGRATALVCSEDIVEFCLEALGGAPQSFH